MQSGPFIEEEIDLRRWWVIINRRKWSILSLAFLVTLLATLFAFSITPVYKATSTLLIEAQQPKLPSIEDIYGLAGSDKQYHLTQLGVLQSRKLAEQVIRELKLDTHPEFVPGEDAFNPISSLKQWLISPLKQWLPLSEESSGEDHTFDQHVIGFQERLTAELVKGTQLIKLSFESESPELAAKVANALANAYIKDQLDSRINMAHQASSWMEQRLKPLKQDLEASEQALQAYKERHGLVDIKGISTLTEQELDELTTQLVITRSKYAELSERYGSKHPKLIAARSELQVAESELARGKSKIQSIGRKAVKLRELQRQVESDRQLYDTFLTSLKGASQAVEMQAVNARISDPAVAPIAPFKPNKRQIVILAFLASLMLGVLLALLYEALDRTFKDSADIEEKLGQPILGLLPLVKADKKDRQAHAFAMLDDNKPAFAEAMRTIRTSLVLSSLDNPHKVILVTSSIPGEGKTTVCTNLAAAMAKMEKVLLIGADLRRPSLSKVMGLTDKVGLTDVVAGTSEFSSCVHRIEDAGFDVLPCGHLPPNPLELLSSKRFASMLDMLEKHYDRIVIDSPPVQAVSDSLVLSQYAKAVIYVVEADSTHEDLVKNGVKRLLQYGAPIAGIVLNKFDVEKSYTYGKEHGGYYDHYGYSDSKS